MQWLAQLCVRQPVFACGADAGRSSSSASSATSQLGARPVPQGRLPGHRRDHAPRRRRAGGGRDRDHRQDRGGGQHHQRHRRAALDVEPRASRMVIIAFVLEKDVDVAAQEVRDHINTRPARPAEGHRPAGRHQVDPDAAPILSSRCAARRPHPRDSPSSPTSRCAARSRASTASARSPSSAAQAPDQRLARPGAAARRRASRPSTCSARSRAEPDDPRRRVETGPTSSRCASQGRVDDVADDRPHRRPRERTTTRSASTTWRASRTASRRRRRSRRGGRQARRVVLSIRKQSGENTVAVVDAVQGAPRRGREDAARRATTLEVVRDNSRVIRTERRRGEGAPRRSARSSRRSSCSSSSATRAARSSPRSPSRSRSSAPSRSCGSMGFTLNIITLLALALAVGIVIDDAIVVLENIVRFIDEKRQKPFVAAVAAPRRDRPRRARDDAVAHGGVPPGRVHERHRRALPEELRPDDGVRHRRLAVRQLLAHADARGALAQGPAPEGERRRSRCSSASSTASTGRSSASTWRSSAGSCATAGSWSSPRA